MAHFYLNFRDDRQPRGGRLDLKFMKMAAFLPPLPLYFTTNSILPPMDSPSFSSSSSVWLLRQTLQRPHSLSAVRNRILSISHGPAGVPQAIRPNFEEARLGGALFATGHCQQETRTWRDH